MKAFGLQASLFGQTLRICSPGGWLETNCCSIAVLPSFAMCGKPWLVLVLAVALHIVHILDIVVHVATKQLEWPRILASAVLIIWSSFEVLDLLVMKLGIAVRWQWVMFGSAAVLYAFLQIIFVAQHTLMNDGKPRVALILFILANLGFTAGFAFANVKRLQAAPGIVDVGTTIVGQQKDVEMTGSLED